MQQISNSSSQKDKKKEEEDFDAYKLALQKFYIKFVEEKKCDMLIDKEGNLLIMDFILISKKKYWDKKSKTFKSKKLK